MKCLNRDALEYRILEKVSGVSGFDLDSCIRYYLDEHDRYPYLDEIPGADSSQDLSESLEIKDTNGIKHITIKKVKEFTGAETIEEAIPIINDKYKDLEVDITEITNDQALIKIKHRPSEYGYRADLIKVNTENNNLRQTIVNALNKLRSLYGINFIEITNDELGSKEWKGKVPEASTANAFVYNGNIYINTDIISDASREEPKIHELLHIFLGAMRYSAPELYFSLVQSMEQLPTLPTISTQYKNRTHGDILEEVFVTEYAKYLSGQKSAIDRLSKEMQSEINYSVRRNLDSVLMGNYSVRSLSDKQIMAETLSSLSEKVESNICSPVFPEFINATTMHRKIANTKEGLRQSGELQEECV